MRIFATAVGVMLMLAGPAFGEEKAASESELQVTKRCLQETAPLDLQQCVRAMAHLIELQDRLRVAMRRLAMDCVEKEAAPEIRECLKPLTTPETPQQKKQSDELKAAVRTWEISTNTSRMDGSPRVYLTLDSEDEVSVGYGRRARPMLALRCLENTTALFVSGEWYLSDTSSVQWRIDDEKPVAQTWHVATNKKAVGLWDGGRSIPFIKSMLGKKTLLIRITTYNDGSREMAFNIEGLDKVIEPLRTACKW